MAEETVANESESQTTEESAQADDLDTLLSKYSQEFDQETNTSEKASKDDDRVAQLEARLERYESTKVAEDVANAAKIIAEEIGENAPSQRVLKAMLNDMAIEDERLLKAFQNRHNDPQTWNKILKSASKEIKKEFPNVDKNATESRAAVEAAVRGSTQPSDDKPDFSKMSDAEFQQWKMAN